MLLFALIYLIFINKREILRIWQSDQGISDRKIPCSIIRNDNKVHCSKLISVSVYLDSWQWKKFYNKKIDPVANQVMSSIWKFLLVA